MRINSKKTLGSILFILVFFLMISLTGLSQIYDYQRLVTMGLSPVLLLFVVALNRFRLPSLKIKVLWAFTAIIVLSILYLFLSVVTFQTDIHWPSSIDNLGKLFGVLLSIIIVLETVEYDSRFVQWYFWCFIVSFLIQAYSVYGHANSAAIQISSNWINREEYDLNANIYSYLAFTANISALYLYEMHRKVKYFILYLGIFSISLYVSFMTVSRSGFVFPVIVLVLYFLIENLSNLKGLLKVGGLAVVFSILSNFVIEQLYSNSYLAQRVARKSVEGDSRSDLAVEGLQVFFDHPFFGVGPGQFYRFSSDQTSFSHNSYIEMMATLGVMGFVVVIYLFGAPILHSLSNSISRNVANPRSRLHRYNLVFFLAFAIYNNLYVFYLNTYMMMFFVLIYYIEYKLVVKIESVNGR
jgi:O-antigen ligase